MPEVFSLFGATPVRVPQQYAQLKVLNSESSKFNLPIHSLHFHHPRIIPHRWEVSRESVSLKRAAKNGAPRGHYYSFISAPIKQRNTAIVPLVGKGWAGSNENVNSAARPTTN